ncbi:MAG: ATP-binding protein [Paracoccaceae bacterium]
MDHAREFTRLYNLEYSEPNELIFRFVSIATGGVILFSYTGWSISIFWLMGYFGLHVYYHYYLTRSREVTTSQHTVHASVVFLAIHAFFIALPTYLMLQPDIAMNFCGTAAIACLLVWLIRRADVLPMIVFGNMVIIAVSVASMLVITLSRVDFFLAKIAMVLCSIGAVAYYAGAVLISRRQRIEAEESAYRSIEAQKMEAIGRLAGGVAHDFNNILTATLGNLDLYYEVPTESERNDCIEQARSAAVRGEALVQRLLAFAGRKNKATERHMLVSIFDKLERLCRPLIPATIVIKVEDLPENMIVMIDEENITTALLNLVVNARDAISETGTITLSADRQHLPSPKVMQDGMPILPGNYIRIDVVDDGPGMQPDVLTRVLEPFFTTKPIGLGSGLGLPMVATFARESGGGLAFDTSPSGTKVSMYLPNP